MNSKQNYKQTTYSQYEHKSNNILPTYGIFALNNATIWKL